MASYINYVSNKNLLSGVALHKYCIDVFWSILNI